MSSNHLVHENSGNYSSEDAPKLHGSRIEIWRRKIPQKITDVLFAD